MERNGFEDNSQYVFFSNTGSFDRPFSVSESIIRNLYRIQRTVDKTENNYVVLGAAVRITEKPRLLGIPYVYLVSKYEAECVKNVLDEASEKQPFS